MMVWIPGRKSGDFFMWKTLEKNVEFCCRLWSCLCYNGGSMNTNEEV